MNASRRASTRPLHSSAIDRRRRSIAGADNLTDQAAELVATRLRLLAHPTRLHVLRALHERDHTERELSERLSLPLDKVRAHARVLLGGGMLSRCDDGSLHLCDWPGWWLIQQLTRGLAVQSRQLRATVEDDACR